MNRVRLLTCMLSKNHNTLWSRNIQVSVIGGASEIGSKLAIMLKQNPKITKLHLYDDDEKVTGVGMELDSVPGESVTYTYAGDTYLPAAIESSNLIVMVSRKPRKPSSKREEMLCANAPAVYNLCKVISKYNPDVFFAISTNPINSIIPFASSLLFRFDCYNPYKIFGITHIDTLRTRALAGDLLKVDPHELFIPVIGGHSEETIVPLFSNMLPSSHKLDNCQSDMLTRIVRKAGTQVVRNKYGTDSATLAMAWSINEFVHGMVDAICGSEVVLTCYTANPHFKSRFFAGPTVVGAHGIMQTCHDFNMSDLESSLLKSCVPNINRDVAQGEEFVRVIENAKKLSW